MSDLNAKFDALFGSGGEEFYPGSRHKREDGPTADLYEESDWDATPMVKSLKGVETEFFTIGDLARAVNRQPVTIRSWERKGYLPKTPYRSAGKRQNRLYTRAQVELVRRVALSEGLMDPTIKKSPKDTAFVEKVAEMWATV